MTAFWGHATGVQNKKVKLLVRHNRYHKISRPGFINHSQEKCESQIFLDFFARHQMISLKENLKNRRNIIREGQQKPTKSQTRTKNKLSIAQSKLFFSFFFLPFFRFFYGFGFFWGGEGGLLSWVKAIWILHQFVMV